MFELSWAERKALNIPYYRRPDHLGHLKLKVKEAREPLSQEECDNLAEEHIFLERRQKCFDFYKASFLSDIPDLLDQFLGADKLGEPGRQYLLSRTKQNSRTTEVILDRFTGVCSAFDPFQKHELELSQPVQSEVIGPEQNSRLLIRVTDESDPEIIVAERMNNNEFTITSNYVSRELVDVFIRPSLANAIQATIDKDQVEALKKLKTWQVLVADPPWDVAGSDPTRGLALPYPTMTIENIFATGWPSLIENGFVFL